MPTLARSPLRNAHALRTNEPRLTIQRLVHRSRAMLRRLDAPLPPDAVDHQFAAVAMELRIDAADQFLALQQRQHVVAELALRARRERFEAVVEPEQPLTAPAVAQHRIKRRKHAHHSAILNAARGLAAPHTF